jgi:hypothetical protein
MKFAQEKATLMFELVEAGYSKVSEYTKYFETYPNLIGPKGDLKDVQRPWVLEKTNELVPIGRVIDLGGAACELAGVLMLTHDVTVVDPYDGSGNGPRNPEPFRRKYPLLKIVQGSLDSQTSLRDFDAVVSTSVVEHIPVERHRETVGGIAAALRIGGYSIHAIDVTVQAVNDFLIHTQQIAESFVRAHGVVFDIAEIRDKILADVDSYFLSPLMYQQWRKDRPFNSYPWRKVASFNVVLKKVR